MLCWLRGLQRSCPVDFLIWCKSVTKGRIRNRLGQSMSIVVETFANTEESAGGSLHVMYGSTWNPLFFHQDLGRDLNVYLCLSKMCDIILPVGSWWFSGTEAAPPISQNFQCSAIGLFSMRGRCLHYAVTDWIDTILTVCMNDRESISWSTVEACVNKRGALCGFCRV